MTWVRMYCAVAVVLGVGAAFPVGSAAQPISMALEPCLALSPAQYNGLSDGDPLKVKYPTFKDYLRYRSTVEVIEYNGLASTANPQLVMPRNVTDQDDVYIRLRGNTYRYSYQASWAASDLTQGDLLNVLGTSPNAGMLAAEEVKEAAGAAKKNADNTDAAKTQPTGGKAQAGLGQFGISDDEFRAITAAITELRTEFEAALTLTNEDGKTPGEALVDLAIESEKLRLELAGLVARAAANPDGTQAITSANDALRAAEGAAKTASALLIQLQSKAEPVFTKVAVQIPRLRTALEGMRISLRGHRDRATQKDLARDLAALEETEATLKTWLDALVALESSAEVAKKELSAMTANFSRAQDALAAVRENLLRFHEQTRTRDICASVGRFRSKSVKVTIKATPVDTRAPSKSAAPGVSTTTGTTAAMPGTPTAPPTPQPAPADGVITSEGSFDASAPTHAHVKLGVIVSTLENPEFKLDKITTGCADGKQCLNPFVAQKHDTQVRPATHVSLYLPGHYLWTDDDPSDPYEIARKHRFTPYPTFGFSLTDTNDNYFIGGGIDLGRGVGLLAGLQLGRVRRLRDGYEVGKQFERPAADTFDVGEIVDTGFHPGAYISLAIDVATIGKVFNLGGK